LAVLSNDDAMSEETAPELTSTKPAQALLFDFN
jgi:hypothetical protein